MDFFFIEKFKSSSHRIKFAEKNEFFKIISSFVYNPICPDFIKILLYISVFGGSIYIFLSAININMPK